MRRRLPQRRNAFAIELEHAGHRFRMQVGCYPDGAVGEVFLDATKQNSMLDALAADAAILISLLLQVGTKGVLDSSDGTDKGKPLNSDAAKFFMPSSIQVDRTNGDVYVSDGEGAGANRRVAVTETVRRPRAPFSTGGL